VLLFSYFLEEANVDVEQTDFASELMWKRLTWLSLFQIFFFQTAMHSIL
jgi:hypothetical protein